jgi:hypothetical protein
MRDDIACCALTDKTTLCSTPIKRYRFSSDKERFFLYISQPYLFPVLEDKPSFYRPNKISCFVSKPTIKTTKYTER